MQQKLFFIKTKIGSITLENALKTKSIGNVVKSRFLNGSKPSLENLLKKNNDTAYKIFLHQPMAW